jgi:hypothetical protein
MWGGLSSWRVDVRMGVKLAGAFVCVCVYLCVGGVPPYLAGGV